ncbi:hypothetical protein ACH5RR_008473 [Cinchona calisaya]|uniref:Uncharacterized protein n=1 Tax=Cinchona calisaya TaxID=153742 RepID=A0ABD3ADZ6_9GENT
MAATTLTNSSSTSESSSSHSTSATVNYSSPHSFFFPCQQHKKHVPETLDFDNFLLWKNLFLNILNCHQVSSHVDGSTTPPATTITNPDGSTSPNPDHASWQQVDYVVLSWIQAIVSVDILEHIIQPGATHG